MCPWCDAKTRAARGVLRMHRGDSTGWKLISAVVAAQDATVYSPHSQLERKDAEAGHVYAPFGFGACIRVLL